ncbi:MAG: class I SAM-dependent methyltransferase [Candidatus Zixiibacteriota bacterium]
MSQYEDSYGTGKRLAFICEAIRQIRPGSVLDIGCGVGQVSYPLAKRFPDVHFHGVDKDEASIEYARRNHIAPNLTFGHEYDPCGQGRDGMIIASEVIEHVESPDEFLMSLRRKLMDTGRLVLTLPNGYGPFEWAAVAEALLKLVGVYALLRKLKGFIATGKPAAPVDPVTLALSPHINFFSYSAISSLLTQAGFAIERYSPRTFLCGFGFDQVIRGERLVSWNSKVADQLPPFASSDWMFLARPSQANGELRAYRRGFLAKTRRYLYEKQYGLR